MAALAGFAATPPGKMHQSVTGGFEFAVPAGCVADACPAGRTENACVAVYCGKKRGDDYLALLESIGSPLEQAAVDNAVFEKKDKAWVAKGRLGAEAPVEPIRGTNWTGLKATVVCGVDDARSRFHGAGGQCLWAVLSDGRRSVVVDTPGVPAPGPRVLAILDSFRFLASVK